MSARRMGAPITRAPPAMRNQMMFTPPTKAMMTKMSTYKSATPASLET